MMNDEFFWVYNKFSGSKGHRPDSSVELSEMIHLYRGRAAQELNVMRLCRDTNIQFSLNLPNYRGYAPCYRRIYYTPNFFRIYDK